MMDLESFKATLTDEQPPSGMPLAVTALWYAGRDDWDRAHELAQQAGGHDGDWVHAYLHRVEGDLGNAAYWYNRVGKPAATGALDEEWAAITAALLSGSD